MENDCGSILIVDDDSDFRSVISTLCLRAGFDCLEAGTSEDAISVALEEHPDAVLLDVNLGAASGYEVCRKLREQFGETLPIIFLSGSRTNSHDRVAGLLLGGDDYVTKPFEPEELLARVRRALARSRRTRPNPGAARFRLTPREGEILRLLAQGLGTHAISERLGISTKTVATHIQRLLAKLHVHSRTEAVALAYREGLLEGAAALNGRR